MLIELKFCRSRQPASCSFSWPQSGKNVPEGEEEMLAAGYLKAVVMSTLSTHLPLEEELLVLIAAEGGRSPSSGGHTLADDPTL